MSQTIAETCRAMAWQSGAPLTQEFFHHVGGGQFLTPANGLACGMDAAPSIDLSKLPGAFRLTANRARDYNTPA
jgi:hypothetical protein